MMPLNAPSTASAVKASRMEVFAWCFFDFANSAYTTVIITAFYVLYFKNIVVDGPMGDFLWGLSIALAMLVVAVTAPVLGAIADCSASKKRFLAFFAGLCVLFTALLYFVGRGDVFFGILFFVVATIGFDAGIVFYNAFLLEIADKKDMGKVSGWGWAIGYFGGMACLLAVMPLAARMSDGDVGLPFAKLTFPVTALFFLVFSLPTFLILKERARPKPLPPGASYIRAGFAQLGQTFANIRRYRELVKFLIAFFIFNDAMTTVIAFAASYADQTLHFTVKENILTLLLVNLSAAPGAFVFGYVVDWIGAKKTIIITLVLWLAVVVGVCLTDSKAEFFWLAMLAGIGLGSCQSASRSLVALFSPPAHSAEFFGFQAVCGKFAAILGPLVFGLVSSFTGNQRYAVLTVGLFFLVGLILMTFVDEQAGIRAASES
ncbi:MAG: MFS transporter, partial [Planctomycetes bacterium]|nr:MFS transporter [Planctomycetota bacterium]